MPRNPSKIDYTGGFPPSFDAFTDLQDPRSTGNTRHHFGEIIFMTFTAILSGMNTYELMEEFADIHFEWFKKWLKLPNGTPSYITFSRVLESLDPDQLNICIAKHLRTVSADESVDHIAIDGKALRGSATDSQRHLHAVSAWASEQGLTLGQTFVDEKSNEITAIPQLLSLLNLKGAVVTIDAMGTQKNIASEINDKEGDYILSVKGNQKELKQEIHDYFMHAAKEVNMKALLPNNWNTNSQRERNRGRDECRTVIVCNNLEWMNLKIKDEWKGLASIIAVQRQVKLKGEQWTTEVEYYISSLKEASAAEIADYIRRHWSIENSCHWVLDMLFKEDANQTGKRNAAMNLGTMRRIALNTLKKADNCSRRKKPSSLVKKQARVAQSDTYREHALSLV